MATTVLVSGGLDSAVALAWTKRQFPSEMVGAMWVDYGQVAARREFAAACRVARSAHIPLSEMAVIRRQDMEADPGLGTGFVRARNLMLSCLAAMHLPRGGRVVLGCIVNDDYPDTTPDYFAHVAPLLSIALDAPDIEVLLPLATFTKTDVARLGLELDVRLWETWSCYFAGKRPCGHCKGCLGRRDGLAGIFQSVGSLRTGVSEIDDALGDMAKSAARAARWRESGVSEHDAVVVEEDPSYADLLADFRSRVRRWGTVYVGTDPDGKRRVTQNASPQLRPSSFAYLNVDAGKNSPPTVSVGVLASGGVYGRGYGQIIYGSQGQLAGAMASYLAAEGRQDAEEVERLETQQLDRRSQKYNLFWLSCLWLFVPTCLGVGGALGVYSIEVEVSWFLWAAVTLIVDGVVSWVIAAIRYSS